MHTKNITVTYLIKMCTLHKFTWYLAWILTIYSYFDINNKMMPILNIIFKIYYVYMRYAWLNINILLSTYIFTILLQIFIITFVRHTKLIMFFGLLMYLTMYRLLECYPLEWFETLDFLVKQLTSVSRKTLTVTNY